MHPSLYRNAPLGETSLPDRLAETAVIAAWLAVPVFAFLAAGQLSPPLHAAGLATLLTLALRFWRSARRGQALEQIQRRLAAYLDQSLLRPVPVHDRHDQRRRHTRQHRPHTHRAPRRQPALLGFDDAIDGADIEPYRGA